MDLLLSLYTAALEWEGAKHTRRSRLGHRIASFEASFDTDIFHSYSFKRARFPITDFPPIDTLFTE